MELASNSNLVFKVTRSQPELVRPAHPTPVEVKRLSNMDDKKSNHHKISFISFYSGTRNGMKGEDRDPAKILKTALSEALVYYYPLAGRLIKEEGPHGRLVVDCTAEGVVFVEADAYVRLDQFREESLQPPFPCIDQLLYDYCEFVTRNGSPVFSMQVTRLLCGGFILVSNFNHVMCDPIGARQFLSAISELARGAKTPSIIPVWQRDLLNTRDTPRLTDENAPSPLPVSVKYMVYRSFFFGSRELEMVPAHIPKHLREVYTDFELITACVVRNWTIALQHDDEERIHVAFPVNVRHMLANPPHPIGYYGNACASGMSVCPAGKLRDVAYVAKEVKKAREEVNEEYVRSSIDLDYSGANTLFVNDISKWFFFRLDFGWGRPVYAGTTDNGSFPHLHSFIVAYRNQSGEEGRLVNLCLPGDAMDRFSTSLQSLINCLFIERKFTSKISDRITSFEKCKNLIK